MITLTLKDIPKSVHSALKNRAKHNGRSLNKEALACLEAAVAPVKVNVRDLLVEFQAHRATLPVRIHDDLLNEAKTKGRP